MVNDMEVKNVSCPLVWEFDGHGTWEAVSRVMDPDMTDEPVETWCREWALMWRISVTEDGEFCCDQSDRLLLKNSVVTDGVWNQLDLLQGRIDLAEAEVRHLSFFRDNRRVCLLPPEIYNRRS